MNAQPKIKILNWNLWNTAKAILHLSPNRECLISILFRFRIYNNFYKSDCDLIKLESTIVLDHYSIFFSFLGFRSYQRFGQIYNRWKHSKQSEHQKVSNRRLFKNFQQSKSNWIICPCCHRFGLCVSYFLSILSDFHSR